MRRTKNDQEIPLEFKGVTLDVAAYIEIQKSANPNDTEGNFIIKFVFKNPNKVFSRDHLISSIWSIKLEMEDRTIDSHIRNIGGTLVLVEIIVLVTEKK
ncbi:winged helix-turn-helix domain-containing protein [Bacillus sp. OV166]|uniref:winged helix-turn-helix domain-containing protein n=1 Tax=Bacillus sp. OV166 TaxID=1882763 RepID=UPI00211B1571|nr:winged helix-turn-helix domain-containing protein [Bacillus sp. OV166]